ncbi:MAG: tetratricopeptide repeat protein [Pyrinomonadaceae bacterium]
MKKLLIGFIGVLMCSVFAFAQDNNSVEAGTEFYRAGKFEKAVETLQRAVAADKKDKLAFVYLGAAYVKLGNKKEAAKAFRNSRFDYKDSLGAFDTPLKTLRKPKATFTDSARANSVKGEVRVAVEFRADGEIGFVFPFVTLPEGLTENAVRAAKEIVFEPAIKNGKAVDVVSVVTYTFDIY